MTRWIMLGLTILGFVVALMAKSPGLLAIGVLLGAVGAFGFVFALAADRVAAHARPEALMASVDDLAALRKRSPRPVSPATQDAPVAPVKEGADGPDRGP